MDAHNPNQDLNKPTVAIIGYAKQGISALKYWTSIGYDATILDMAENIEVPEDIKTVLGPDYLKNLDRFDLIVRTPRLHPQQIIQANPETPDILNKVTTVTNEFMRIVSTPIIGITGTKGKGTTTLLIDAILREAGFKTVVGGNIGISPFDILEESSKVDYVVLELSNFQTIDLEHSPHIGVCLKLTPEHLDWHRDYQEYIDSKKQMFANQTDDDIAVYCHGVEATPHVCVDVDDQDNHIHTVHANNDSWYAVSESRASLKLDYEVPVSEQEVPSGNSFIDVSGDDIRVMGQPMLKTSDVKLLGRHSLQNACAAIAATWQIIGGDTDAFKRALAKSTGFEHRLETVRVVNGITYINDSFASAPDSTIVALDSLPNQNIILIVGGHNKNSDYAQLGKAIAEAKVKHLITIGVTGEQILAAAQKHRPDIQHSPGGDTMSSIITACNAVATAGDTILLSTASASFGLFKDFFDRGNQFRQVVEEL